MKYNFFDHYSHNRIIIIIKIIIIIIIKIIIIIIIIIKHEQTNKPMSSSYIKGPELHSPSHRRIRRWWLEAHGLPISRIYVLMS